ncbi:MAG: hypothetical protein K9J17_03395 [Flavobacteriales bacterium]|nr:hypothetical protein [Flavobacteriales bacterium]
MRNIRALLGAFSAALLLFSNSQLFAQDNVGIGTTSPDPSALLEIQALNKGLLIPRTDTLAITNPATGLLIYTVTDSSFWYFDGIYWRRGIGPEGPAGPLIPGLQGQTMRYDTVFFNDWVANSFIWNNEYHVGINTDQPDSSAILHLVAENKGFLAPQMDKNSRDNIPNPAVGLVIVNTTDSTVDYYNGSCWLPTFAEDCNSCYLSVTPSSLADTIDRVISQTQNLSLDIVQTAGNPQQLAITLLTTLPSGLTATITPNPAPSTGVVDIEFFATPFAPAGTYPIVLQVLCNNSTYNIVYSLTILPCYEVPVINTTNNYDLGTDFYNLYPNAPTTSPVCVVCLIGSGVEISSPTTADPAFSTGNLPAGSLVAIVNNGNILGRGGDGGDAYDPALGLTGEGEDGGTAIDLTLSADIVNNFNIFGGGGGGGSMAFSISTGNLIPPPAPAFGFFLGAGGGGGANLGEGGSQPNGLIGLSFYSGGTDGTGGQFGVPGQGGILNFPITFAIGPAQVDINPNAIGGNGGPYGYPGTQGVFQITISVSVVVNIPFIGPIVVPVVTNLSIPIPAPPPAAGAGGYAVKRNGFTTNIPDNLYNTSFLRGTVGP